MAKVYVVTTGDYSDYEIEGIFSTEELADKYAKMLDSDYASSCVEEFEIDPEKEILNRGYGHWRIHMMRDGKVSLAVVCQHEPDGSDWDHAKVLKATWLISGEGYLNCRMKARDRDHAVKIANERRTAILAAHQWPADPPAEE